MLGIFGPVLSIIVAISVFFLLWKVFKFALKGALFIAIAIVGLYILFTFIF